MRLNSVVFALRSANADSDLTFSRRRTWTFRPHDKISNLSPRKVKQRFCSSALAFVLVPCPVGEGMAGLGLSLTSLGTYKNESLSAANTGLLFTSRRRDATAEPGF